MPGNGIQIILIGGSLLVIGISLWKSSQMRNRINKRDPLDEVEKQLQSQRRASPIREMEVRLYEYGREVEGRVSSTMALLDHLVLNAEQEIEKLESLLGEDESSSGSRVSLSLISGSGQTELSTGQKARIPGFQEAGLSAEEIARCLQVPKLLVDHFLNDDEGHSARVA